MNPPERPYDLAVVGEINPDLILSGDVVPRFGQVEQIANDLTLTIGSSAAIFACGAALLGLKVLFLGKVGGDEFGAFMLRAMAQRGVDTSQVRIDPSLRTGLSVILNTGTDRAILTYPGAIPLLEFEDLPLDQLALARHLHITSYFIQDCLRPRIPELYARAREMGLSTSLDTNYDPANAWNGVDAVIPLLDVLLPNETEARGMTGEADADRAVSVLARRVPTLAVKLGAQGAQAVGAGQVVSAPALKVDVVDTVGAGDTFDAGFLYGYLHGWPLERSLRLGLACGSLSTRGPGGTSAQPTLAEALQFV
jgi:sugar/nucleoside kinase (ribokinase family)